MKHFFLIVNHDKPRALSCRDEILGYLRAHGADCRAAEEEPSTGKRHYTDAQKVPAETECVLVIGGDGTLIEAAHDLRGCDLPFIGVNVGHLGYLAETEADDISDVRRMLDGLLRDEYHIEERMLLYGEVLRDGRVIHRDTALNDIVLSRYDTLKMISFSLAVDDQELATWHADGIIIATPTGSTAYSLSCGGPIVMPTSRLFVVTPICAHTLANARSIVLPEGVTISMTVGERPGSRNVSSAVCFDSEASVTLEPGDVIRVSKAADYVRLIRFRQQSFLETLSRKLV